MEKYYLPFNQDLGYPQKIRLRIPNTGRLFDIVYAYNHTGFITITITEVSTGEIIKTGKLLEYTQMLVRDKTTRKVIFSLVPESIRTSNLRIRMYWEGMGEW